jgi:hypothetical protein
MQAELEIGAGASKLGFGFTDGRKRRNVGRGEFIVGGHFLFGQMKDLKGMPWRVALSAERRSPSGVRGPVDFWALARLTARRRSETGRLGAGSGVAGAGAGDSATGADAPLTGSDTSGSDGSGSAGRTNCVPSRRAFIPNLLWAHFDGHTSTLPIARLRIDHLFVAFASTSSSVKSTTAAVVRFAGRATVRGLAINH